MPNVVAYVCSMLVFVALDGVWLTLMSERLYRPALGEILATRVDMPAAAAFYLIYGLGLTVLASRPALKEASPGRAAVNGAVLGLVAYATYDLTNQATLRVWATRLTLADIAWGMVVTTIAALAGYYGGRLAQR